MTKALFVSVATSIALLLLSPIFASAQAPPQTQPAASGLATMMSAQQANQSDKQNFPPLLLQQLSAIKAAALGDDARTNGLTIREDQPR